MKKVLFLFFLVLLSATLISPCGATSVVYENNSLVVSEVPDDGIGLGAFDIVLLYPETVRVSNITLTPPFTGAVNDQQEGRIILAGFQVSDVLTGDVPVASLTVTGDPALLDIRVRSLYNQKSDEISRTNADYSEPVTPSGGESGDSGDPSGVQTPVTSETVAQNSDSVSSGPSSGAQDQDINGSEPVVATSPSVSSTPLSKENVSATSDVPALDGSNATEPTSPQKSPISCFGIFISVSVAVLLCWKFNRKEK